MIKTVFTEKAPAAIGPYSQAKIYNQEKLQEMILLPRQSK